MKLIAADPTLLRKKRNQHFERLNRGAKCDCGASHPLLQGLKKPEKH
jgi:hypothetical protein